MLEVSATAILYFKKKEVKKSSIQMPTDYEEFIKNCKICLSMDDYKYDEEELEIELEKEGEEKEQLLEGNYSDNTEFLAPSNNPVVHVYLPENAKQKKSKPTPQSKEKAKLLGKATLINSQIMNDFNNQPDSIDINPSNDTTIRASEIISSESIVNQYKNNEEMKQQTQESQPIMNNNNNKVSKNINIYQSVSVPIEQNIVIFDKEEEEEEEEDDDEVVYETFKEKIEDIVKDEFKRTYNNILHNLRYNNENLNKHINYVYHDNIQCEECKMEPIAGNLFLCILCDKPMYFCDKCSFGHEHPMIQIKGPLNKVKK